MTRKLELACKPVSFIGAYFLEDPSVCDELIDFFKANPELHRRGSVNTAAGGSNIDDAIKQSTEIVFQPRAIAPPFVRYANALQECVKEYIADYEYCNSYAAWSILEGTNLQHYPPGGGYKVWHTERNNAQPFVSWRHLVFMTYLNTLDDGGETEFFYQDLRVKPEKGLTLIWPADWTHTHRGVPSPTQEKYIITGWFDYVPG
jgi:hypothetical protein